VDLTVGTYAFTTQRVHTILHITLLNQQDLLKENPNMQTNVSPADIAE
jgi:hypothetical protein